MDEAARAEWMKSVVDRFYGPLSRYAAVILGDMERSRDVVQDTFMRLWKEDPSRVEARLSEWLFTVCRNRALDHLRKEGRMQSLDDMDLNTCGAPEASPAAQLELKDTHNLVLQHLSKLPKNQQEVIRLKFQNGLSYEEIGRITHRTVTNVGVLIHMAIKALRQKMQETEMNEMERRTS